MPSRQRRGKTGLEFWNADLGGFRAATAAGSGDVRLLALVETLPVHPHGRQDPPRAWRRAFFATNVLLRRIQDTSVCGMTECFWKLGLAQYKHDLNGLYFVVGTLPELEEGPLLVFVFFVLQDSGLCTFWMTTKTRSKFVPESDLLFFELNYCIT